MRGIQNVPGKCKWNKIIWKYYLYFLTYFPSISKHFCKRFRHLSNPFLKSLGSWELNQVFVILASSIDVKLVPFRLKIWKKKKIGRVKSGLYSGWLNNGQRYSCSVNLKSRDEYETEFCCEVSWAFFFPTSVWNVRKTVSIECIYCLSTNKEVSLQAEHYLTKDEK